jgi:hypothetical protein
MLKVVSAGNFSIVLHQWVLSGVRLAWQVGPHLQNFLKIILSGAVRCFRLPA